MEEADLSLGKSKQSGLRFVFEFTSIYDPKVGEITLNGEVLYLEDEYSIGTIGRLRTRIQAFLEMIG